MPRLITPSTCGPLSITVYQVVGGDKTVQQLAKSMVRRPLTRTVDRPDGDTVGLRTTVANPKTDDRGHLHAAITDEYLDEYTAPGGTLSSVVKARTIKIVFTHNLSHLLVFAGKQVAGPIAAKVSRIAFNAANDPVLACNISPDRIDNFITSHDAQIQSCSWRELQIPSLSGASLNGYEIGANAEFQRFDQHGFKNSVRLRLPAMGMTLSINREASLHFYTSHEPHEQIAFIVQHVIPLCR